MTSLHPYQKSLPFPRYFSLLLSETESLLLQTWPWLDTVLGEVVLDSS